MVRGNACDHLRGLVSRINSLCGLFELTVVRVQIDAADLEESLDRDADKMLRENHPLVLATAEGEVRFEPRAVFRGEVAHEGLQFRVCRFIPSLQLAYNLATNHSPSS